MTPAREGGRTERRGTWILPVSALVFSPEDLAVHPFCTPVVHFRSESETDLGPGVLHCSAAMSNLDIPLLKQQNTKKLHGTKNNCMHAQLGQILDPRDTKRPNNNNNHQ